MRLLRLVVLGEHLLAQRFGGRGVDRRRGEELQPLLAQRATGFALCLQVGRRRLGDLPDLRALRIGGVQAVEHVVGHAADALGAAHRHHAVAAHAVATHAVAAHPWPTHAVAARFALGPDRHRQPGGNRHQR